MKRRKTLRIARWEVSKNAGQFDRRTLAVVAVVLLFVAVLTPMVASRGNTVDDGIYRVGVSEDSQYYGPVATDPTFVAVEPTAETYESGEFDVFVCTGDAVPNCPRDALRYKDSPKGKAALAELRTTVERYNDERMAEEPDRAAAFPVNVTLRYVQQNATAGAPGAGKSGASGPGAGDGITTRTTTAGETRLGGSDGAGSGGAGTDGTGGNDAGGRDGSATGSVAAPSVGSGSSIFVDNERQGTPSDISPPFPFESLVLAFAFILPMNFVIQAYASSVIEERINDRGELLLVSPVSRGDIIVGKTLPYFVGMVAIATVTAVGIVQFTPNVGTEPLAVAGAVVTAVSAVIPIALLFLASAFVGAMFSRSFKELTFVTVSLSVFLTSYAFVPSVFTDVHPIASISPLSLVVRVLQGESVALGQYAFSTLPLFLTAGVLFALGAGVYREEDMFTQRPVTLKALDALDSQLHGMRSVAKCSALSIPFVFVAELLAVALLFALPVDLSIPVLLLAIAFIEEVAKSVHVYAGFSHSRFDRSLRTVGSLGLLSGFGFFVGEKLTAIAQLVGLPNLELGRAAFGAATGLGVDASPLVLLGLLFAPLALHSVTATVTAYGASKDRNWYAWTLAVTTLVHAAYNLTVVNALG
ncbi:ABC-type transport system permease protein [Haladaptatus paucihalophilus DX253]|uniref:ABC-type transport system permease protein n=1 Tax=Haladaptatus paucihalophilus DX253 TaxID=797209 RepID=E7QX90_HALPU|nr:ABC transporter permease subunit [Haladaptatus paucihalophilus]EFW90893.1 ABC-type transport system permease protein [Haladaptatus paucihalophilus DX253]SHK25225.1 ABC-type transport system permease protein [Haladaptatus paucihalophilus DX253]